LSLYFLSCWLIGEGNDPSAERLRIHELQSLQTASLPEEMPSGAHHDGVDYEPELIEQVLS
jgi:hypothetical protein